MTAIGEGKSVVPSRQCTGPCVQSVGQKSIKLDYELLPHPEYYLDLASSDYFLFSYLKKWLEGKRFLVELRGYIAETSPYFERLEETYYMNGIKKLEKPLYYHVLTEYDK